MIRAWLIAALAMTALHASAEVFTYIDAQGNRVYTDQPRGNAKRVPLTTSNRMPATPTAVPMTTAKNRRNNLRSITTCCAFWCPSPTRPFAAVPVS